MDVTTAAALEPHTARQALDFFADYCLRFGAVSKMEGAVGFGEGSPE